MTTLVSMQVNQANLVNSLRFSFTHKTTVLGELMQNARRAKATYVGFDFDEATKTLQVTDDGCGIESIATLLTVAESGWDSDVVAQEHPFGIGFLSALFACRHITVASKSGQLSVETADILSFKPVTITPVSHWDNITALTLVGVDFDLPQIEKVLKQLARGFPIPVILNGNPLARAFALDSSLEFIETEIGFVCLQGLDAPGDHCKDIDVYLQGLPIYRSYASYELLQRHIIHLDSSGFYARLPDRDKLIDQDDVVSKINAVLREEIGKHFVRFKATAEPSHFVGFFEMLRAWDLLPLLNDVPVVPRQVLEEIVDYPVCNEEVYGSFLSLLPKPLTRPALERQGVVNIDDDIQCDGSARYLYAKEKGYLVYVGGLDKGHWLHATVMNLDEPVIELVNETHEARFEGDWVSVTVRFCEAYRIHIGDRFVEIAGDALYRGQDKEDDIIMPKGDASGFVLKQVSSYRDEYDGFQESTHENDSYAFSSFVVANTASHPADAMKRLLPGFSGCPALYGKSFAISINDKGNVASVEPFLPPVSSERPLAFQATATH